VSVGEFLSSLVWPRHFLLRGASLHAAHFSSEGPGSNPRPPEEGCGETSPRHFGCEAGAPTPDSREARVRPGPSAGHLTETAEGLSWSPIRYSSCPRDSTRGDSCVKGRLAEGFAGQPARDAAFGTAPRRTAESGPRTRMAGQRFPEPINDEGVTQCGIVYRCLGYRSPRRYDGRSVGPH
jgi:hypothetical protein